MPAKFMLSSGTVVLEITVAGVSKVGRLGGNDFIIRHHLVSRRHALLTVTGEGDDLAMSVTDIGSKNGTFLNGSKINGKTSLRVGDTISFGGAPAVTLCVPAS